MVYESRALHNPYPHVVPDLSAVLEDVTDKTAQLIASRQHGNQLSGRSLGLCLMDPTITAGPAEEAVLALVTIGPDGRDFLETGVAKAITTWEHRLACGVARYVYPHLLPDGSSVWGHSPIVDGTIVGASGLTEFEDNFVAHCFAADFNLRIAKAHKTWLADHPDSSWYCNENIPRQLFRRVARMFDGAPILPLGEIDPDNDPSDKLLDELSMLDDEADLLPVGAPEYEMPTHPAAVPPLPPRTSPQDRTGYDDGTDAADPDEDEDDGRVPS